MATAIKVENLSKIYRLGEIGTGTISRDIERFVKTRILKQEDPFLKIGEANDRATKGESDIIYSLKDINFEIEQGDAVGIIGRNGAGKSTLLKILSRVTSPTAGKINIKGRVASLLEVGTGFHPELTGRENIYLNGAILGMRKREIDRKLDEIIDFSGVERYIDTPVKRYSNGMYVRLAFAVAAHLESEILIVDEVLAVGDAEFQKKCLWKMGEVSKVEGRTVLFVSHNLASVMRFCKHGILLKNGNIFFQDKISKVAENYVKTESNIFEKVSKRKDRVGNGNVKLLNVEIVNLNELRSTGSIVVKIEYESLSSSTAINEFAISIWDSFETRLISISSNLKQELKLIPINGEVYCEIPFLPLVKGMYFLNASVYSKFGLEDYVEKVIQFEVFNFDYFGNGYFVDSEWGKIILEHKWTI
jgi:lipopolysaccharide transport system ATP-binding protein